MNSCQVTEYYIQPMDVANLRAHMSLKVATITGLFLINPLPLISFLVQGLVSSDLSRNDTVLSYSMLG